MVRSKQTYKLKKMNEHIQGRKDTFDGQHKIRPDRIEFNSIKFNCIKPDKILILCNI